MTARFEPASAARDHASDLIAAMRRAARQEQFLEVVSAEEAHDPRDIERVILDAYGHAMTSA